MQIGRPSVRARHYRLDKANSYGLLLWLNQPLPICKRDLRRSYALNNAELPSTTTRRRPGTDRNGPSAELFATDGGSRRPAKARSAPKGPDLARASGCVSLVHRSSWHKPFTGSQVAVFWGRNDAPKHRACRRRIDRPDGPIDGMHHRDAGLRKHSKHCQCQQ